MHEDIPTWLGEFSSCLAGFSSCLAGFSSSLAENFFCGVAYVKLTSTLHNPAVQQVDYAVGIVSIALRVGHHDYSGALLV